MGRTNSRNMPFGCNLFWQFERVQKDFNVLERYKILKKIKTLQVSLIQSAHGGCSSYQEHTCPWDVPLLSLLVQQQDGVSDDCSHTERF